MDPPGDAERTRHRNPLASMSQVSFSEPDERAGPTDWQAPQDNRLASQIASSGSQ
jgi:hypothetical protein